MHSILKNERAVVKVGIAVWILALKTKTGRSCDRPVSIMEIYVRENVRLGLNKSLVESFI